MFVTIEAKTRIWKCFLSKGERYRLRADGPNGRAYLEAVKCGAKHVEIEGVEIPLSALREVYRGDCAKTASRPGSEDL